MAALYTQGLPCPSPPTRALPPQVNRSRAGNGPWWWRRAPRTGGAHPGRRKRGRQASQTSHSCMGCRGQGTAQINTSRAGKGTFSRVQRPAAGTIPPPPNQRQRPPAAAAGERARAHRYGAHCAEAMAPTSRCAAPPRQASPSRRSDGPAGKPCGLMRTQSRYNPSTAAWPRCSAVRGHAAQHCPYTHVNERSTLSNTRGTEHAHPTAGPGGTHPPGGRHRVWASRWRLWGTW